MEDDCLIYKSPAVFAASILPYLHRKNIEVRGPSESVLCERNNFRAHSFIMRKI